MTRQQARTIACGLLHDGIRADKLSPKARAEVRAALDVILKLAGKTKSAAPGSFHEPASPEPSQEA